MHTKADSLEWVAEGTRYLLNELAGLTDDDVQADSTLPGWTVGQLLAHIAANADGLSNLAHWAATGVETPMYASAEARNAALEDARRLSSMDVVSLVRNSAERLTTRLAALTDEQWQTPVRTIQGRTLPATEIPWLRAREVCVHAVDLDRGLSFADLPEGFLRELAAEVTNKRELPNLPEGPLPEVVAWLTGRPHHLVGAPELGLWL